MAAGVGEEVSSDWLRARRREDIEHLLWLRGTGQSDQRRAAIDRIIAEKKAGVQTPEKEFLKQYSEARSVGDINISQEQRRYEQFGYSRDEARVLAIASVQSGGMTFTPEAAAQIVGKTTSFQRRQQAEQEAAVIRQQKIEEERTYQKTSPEKDYYFNRPVSAEAGGQVTSTVQPKIFTDIKDIFFTPTEFKDIGKEKGFKGKLRGGATIVQLPFTAFGNLVETVGTEIQTRGTTKSFVAGEVVKGVSDLVPETLGGTLTLYGAARGVTALPTFYRGVVSGGLGTVGIMGVLSPETTIREKTTYGIIGGLGVTGFVYETTPYVRGVLTQTVGRIKGEYSPVKTQAEGFKAIELKDTRVGLILEGSPAKSGRTSDIKLPDISPLKRGGFEVKQSEKSLFLGKDQTLATSQIGLFKEGKEIKLEREFFTTPQEPFVKIPETRISRLGLGNLFKLPKETEMSFKLFPEKPQIGLTVSSVGKVETPTTFKIGKGTELEAIKSSGTITGIKKVGVTTIRGEGVDIFKFDIRRDVKTPSQKTIKTSTTSTTTKVSGFTSLSASLSTVKTTEITPTITTPTKTFPTYTFSTPTKTSPTKTTSSVPTTIKSPSVSPPTTIKTIPTVPPTLKTTPTLPPTLISPPKSPPTTIKQPPTTPTLFKGGAKSRRITGKYSVSLRRFGVFRTIGSGLSLSKAMTLGRERTGRTLARTYKITGGNLRGLRTPVGYKKKTTKKGIYFIETSKLALNVPTEIKEIQRARRRKKK